MIVLRERQTQTRTLSPWLVQVSWNAKCIHIYIIDKDPVRFTTRNSDFAMYHMHSAKTKKHSAKALPSVTLGKQHTASIVSENSYLPSVFYRALGKWFVSVKFDTRQKKVVCRVFSKIHSAKDYCLPSVFGNYTRQTYFPKKK